MSSVLQAVRRFTFFALAPVVYSLGIILGIVLLYPIIGPVGLAWGVVLGACLHLLVQFPAVFHLGFRWNGIFTWQNKEVKQVLKLMIPRVLALSANQVNQLVNTFLTSHLAAGSVFIFYSAYDLASVPVSLVAVSLAVSSFPVLAEKFVKKDIDTFRQVLLKIIRHILILVIPISIFMILLRAQIIRLTLGYGRYNWNDTIRTFEVLAVFSLSLFAQSLVPPLARAFYARQNTKTPLLISIVSILINIILGFVLVQSYGLLGLTAAFSIASIINCLVLWLVLQFEVKGLIDIKIIKDLSQYVLAAVVAGLTLYSSLRLSAFLFGTQRVWSLLVQTVLSFLVGSGAYLLVLWGLGDIEIKKLKIRYLR
jgi:putative peptidoglycan lipid II flippase